MLKIDKCTKAENHKKLPNNVKTDKVVKFVDNKNRNNKDINKSHKKARKAWLPKHLVTEIQVSDSDTSIEDNNFVGWRHLPEIASTSEDSDTCDMG